MSKVHWWNFIKRSQIKSKEVELEYYRQYKERMQSVIEKEKRGMRPNEFKFKFKEK